MQIPDCSNKSDEELVKLVMQNQDFFYCLIKRYETKLFHYIIRLSSTNQENAEDILQEIFLKIYRNLNDFDPSLKFSSWAYRITHNETIDFFRKNKNKSNVISLDNEENNHLINLLKSSFDLKEDFNQKETALKVRECIDRLPHKYSQILILRYLEEKDYQEISDILQKPMGTIATLLNRAKTKFKTEAIQNHLDELI